MDRNEICTSLKRLMLLTIYIVIIDSYNTQSQISINYLVCHHNNIDALLRVDNICFCIFWYEIMVKMYGYNFLKCEKHEI